MNEIESDDDHNFIKEYIARLKTSMNAFASDPFDAFHVLIPNNV